MGQVNGGLTVGALNVTQRKKLRYKMVEELTLGAMGQGYRSQTQILVSLGPSALSGV